MDLICYRASQSTIHVSAVVCGERTVEATTMLKSTTIFTNRTVQFHVLAEDQLHDEVKNIFHQWQTVQSGQVMFKLYSLQFPVGENADEWKKLFKPCAAQRLFLSVSIFFYSNDHFPCIHKHNLHYLLLCYLSSWYKVSGQKPYWTTKSRGHWSSDS